MLTLIMLIVVAWLLWTVREELEELNERQRSLRAAVDRIEKQLNTPEKTD